MTVQSTISRSGPYAGAGTAGPFTVGFRFLDNTHLLVVRQDAAGIETTLAYPADYSVTGARNTTGAVTTTAVLAVGQSLTVQLNVPITQLLDYVQSDSFPAESHEDGLDKLTMIALQLQLTLNGALRVPETATSLVTLPAAAARANTTLGFDGSGRPTVLTPVSGSAADVLTRLADAADPAKGDALVGVKRAVTGAVTTTQHAVNENRVFDIKADFGAVGDGIVDDTAAFAAAYKAALSFYGASSLSAATVYLSPGTYLITANNFLGSIDFTTLTGGFDTRINLTILGAGWGSNILWRPTSVGTDQWMYDQGTAGVPKNILIYPTFQNLTITHDVVNLSGGAKANGFRVLGTSGVNGVAQGFKFINAYFTIADVGNGVSAEKRAKCGTFMRLAGSVNASEMTWTGSLIKAYATVLDIGPNGEAVNHNFTNTSCEFIYGDVFKVSGGHSINVRGGSWIMESETLSYFLALRQSTISITGAFFFEGGRFELRVNSAGTFLSNVLLCDATGFPSAFQSSFPVVKFAGWTSKISGTSRDTFVIDAAMPTKVSFDGCSIGDIGVTTLHKVRVNSSRSGLQAANTFWWMSELDFTNGDAVPFDNVSFTDNNSTAKISSRNSRNSIDYDLTANGRSDQILGRAIPMKTATFWGTSWPDLGNNGTMSIRMPKGALLKSARFRKAANGGAATAGYRLAMVDGALNQYCISAAAAQNTEHKALADNLNIILDDALGYVATISAAQVIFLIAPAGNLGSAQAVALAKTDYAMVDYW